MIQRDYILRLIEQFAQIARRLLHLRQERRYEQALQLIRQSYKTFMGGSAEFIDSQSAQELIDLMRNGVVSPAQLGMAARLMQEEAHALEGLEKEIDAKLLRLKSLHLYLAVFGGPGCAPLQVFAREPEILLAHFTDDALPGAIVRLLPSYFEKTDRFDKAEDALFELAETASRDDPVFRLGEEFYQRLLALPDDRLAAGGLPRDEVEAGLREFLALRDRS